MTDTLLWFALICSALGTGVTALTTSGIGRMHPLDVRELRRHEHFGDVLSRHVAATRLLPPPPPPHAPDATPR
ncbi:hypothetical protein [Streptomyces sp. C]|uniref:hypothetical protein n=1 Tax=Streptomyces sp. C TaxID=253839 RepID=UPI0001DEF0D9|nr:hypothetical protein [Streptomyces sp. C]EFL16566.1 predicted protein [Streptomyces sp. C]